MSNLSVHNFEINNYNITYDAYVGGRFLSGTDSQSEFVCYEKYSQSPIATISNLSASEIEFTLSSAEVGGNELKRLDAKERSGFLYRLYEEITNHKDEMALLICAEAGKPLSYAIAEVERTLNTLQLCAESAKNVTTIKQHMSYGLTKGLSSNTILEPIGTVFCMTPFNFPLNLLMHKLGPALAVGCSVIIKPSPKTP